MNRKQEDPMHNRTTEEWKELVERYFDATLSNEEEEQLRLFLASEASSSPIFDEAKAVIGYLSVSKAHKGKQHKKRNIIIGQIARYSAAAAIILAISIGITHNYNNSEEIYIAYIDGKQYTDQATVLSQMHKAIAHVSNNTGQYSAKEQLSNIFSTLNENSQNIEIKTE